MSSWRRHVHRCPCCLKLRSCHFDCELTEEVVGSDGSDRPVGPSAHGGNGGMYVGNPIFCARCAPYLDPEAADLLVTLNRIPGLRTLESCCGHGEETFTVWLEATPEATLTLRRVLAGSQPNGRQWKLRVDPIHDRGVRLEPPEQHPYTLKSVDKGAAAYGQAKFLARSIAEVLT